MAGTTIRIRINPDALVRIRKLESRARELVERYQALRLELEKGLSIQYLSPDGTWVDLRRKTGGNDG